MAPPRQRWRRAGAAAAAVACLCRGVTSVSPAACGLPSAVPEAQRRNISVNGISTRLGIQQLAWTSSRIAAQVAGIIIQEILGIHATVLPETTSSLTALYNIAGCTGSASNRVCGSDFSEAHVGVELWDSGITGALDSVTSELGDLMPEDLGSIGYDGFESVFIAAGPKIRAMAVEGLALEFYKSHNISWHNPAPYFQSYTSVSTSGLLPCSETRFYKEAIPKYVEITGDTDGVEVVDGATVARCAGGKTGYWWFSPACRSNPATCIPAITAGDGWLVDALMQRAAAYNMPVAIAVGTYSTYEATPRAVDMMFYWWKPDTTFIDLHPSSVKFPDNDKTSWESGNFLTESEKVPCRKWAHHLLGVSYARVREFMSLMQLTSAQMDTMLLAKKRNSSITEGEVACNWLKANMQIWERWIPLQTKCAQGWGLVDATEAYVLNRSDAVSCKWCPPGRFSEKVVDSQGATQVCVECPIGEHQPSPAQVSCLQCSAGTFSAVTGASVCDDCPMGQASSAVGSTGCGDCHAGSFQDMLGSTACAPCPAGAFQGEEGATGCEPCDRGSYSGSNATACEPCAAGSSTSKLGSQECEQCEAGRFAAAPGGWNCTACPIGKFSSAVGSTACQVCGGGAPLWTTMRLLAVQGEERWVSTDGASTEESCGCDVGARFDAEGRCVQCVVDGIECPGMGEVVVQPGFYSPPLLSVYNCKTMLRCPGGAPGSTCAPGRVGVACARCADWMTPGKDGACVPCTADDTIPFTLAVIGTAISCILLYAWFDRAPEGEPSHGAVLAGISGGLLVGLMQQLSVLGVMNISYAEPLSSFLQIMKIFAFDVEDILRLNCVGSIDALAHFCTKVCMILVAMGFVGIIHILFVLARHQARFRARMPTLIAVFGTLVMIFYISVTLTILRPLQCNSNPNGRWTNHVYEDVLCWEWDSEEGSVHLSMIIISIIALSLPIAVLTKVYALVRRYPGAVRRGDTEFLRSFGFLFFRFRPQAHWYILVVMTRSLFVGIVPVIPNATLQIYMLMVALQSTLETTIHFKPWRVHNLNWMDMFFGSIMVLFLTMASFMVKDPNIEVLGWICVSMVLLALTLIPVILAYAAFKRLGAVAKAYQFFLCHAKADAGSFARWLKMELVASEGVKRDVFLDADNLESLDQLLSFVATDVQTLVVLSSRSLFFRPWCIGEMTTANNNSVDSIVLSLPCAHVLDAGSIEAFESLVPDLECLLDNGMRMDAIKKAIATFCEKPAIKVPMDIDSDGCAELCRMLAEGVQRGCVQMTAMPQCEAKTIIVVDLGTFEANAAAHVLQRLLVSHTCSSADEIPRVLPASQEISPQTEKVLIVCTAGCFDQSSFIARILEVSDRALLVLPVIADNDFRVPSKEALRSIDVSALPEGDDGHPRTVGEVSLVILTLFKEIAVSFSPKMATATVLVATVAKVGQRLTHKRMRVGLGSTTPSASDRFSEPHPSDGDKADRSPASMTEASAEDIHMPMRLRANSRWRDAVERNASDESLGRHSFALDIVACIAINSSVSTTSKEFSDGP